MVLWLHGITVNKDEYLNFFSDGAKYLYDYGFDSLRFDFRGHGESSGTSLDFSISGQMLDIESVIDYLFTYYKKNELRINLVGCSFGAPPAIYSALRYPDIVQGITLIAPVLSYKRTFINPETDWAQSIFNKKTLSKLSKTNKLYVNDDFPISAGLVEEMRLIEPDLALKQVKQDIVILHGDSDTMVPFSVSRDIADSSPRIRLVSFRNMDHGFTDIDDEIGTSKKSKENKKRIYEIIAEQYI
ncbi:lysophospholipase [Patescibacteria group bacterium]|nr:lysophospholipase [Patescibacteria group bacterium]